MRVRGNRGRTGVVFDLVLLLCFLLPVICFALNFFFPLFLSAYLIILLRPPSLCSFILSFTSNVSDMSKRVDIFFIRGFVSVMEIFSKRTLSPRIFNRTNTFKKIRYSQNTSSESLA